MTNRIPHPPCAIIVMGVAGCGKTSVTRALADQLGWHFIESDDYHSPEHICKMSSGIPLTDADRQPWLVELNAIMRQSNAAGQSCVLACSALKEHYREVLRHGLKNAIFIYLKGSFDLIRGRMAKRDHFMKPSMLQSQFDALEEPADALVLDIAQPLDALVAEAAAYVQNYLNEIPEEDTHAH